MSDPLDQPSPRRRCTAKNRRGEPCRATPLLDRDRCLAHAEDAREKAGFGGSQPGAGRPAKPRVVDVIRERIERDIDEVITPLFDALQAEHALVTQRDGIVGSEADHAVRLRAVAELLDRAYGRPKQQTELTGADGGPLAASGELVILDPAARSAAQELRENLARAARDAGPLRPHGE